MKGDVKGMECLEQPDLAQARGRGGVKGVCRGVCRGRYGAWEGHGGSSHLEHRAEAHVLPVDLVRSKDGGLRLAVDGVVGEELILLTDREEEVLCEYAVASPV